MREMVRKLTIEPITNPTAGRNKVESSLTDNLSSAASGDLLSMNLALASEATRLLGSVVAGTPQTARVLMEYIASKYL